MSRRKAGTLAVLLVVASTMYLWSCTQASWSPNGKSLALTLWNPKGDDAGDKGGTASALVVYNVTDGSSRIVMKSPYRLTAAGWSPDGTTLAVMEMGKVAPPVEKKADSGPATAASAAAVASALPAASAAPSTSAAPAASAPPAASAAAAPGPVAPVAERFFNRLYLVTPADGQSRVLAEAVFTELKFMHPDKMISEPVPQWLKDGRQIIWPITELGQVRLVDVATGQVARQLETAVFPVLAPSGRLVAMMNTGDKETVTGLEVYDLEKQERRTVVKADASLNGQLVGFNPAWSPDSARIIYVKSVVRQIKAAPAAQPAPASPATPPPADTSAKPAADLAAKPATDPAKTDAPPAAVEQTQEIGELWAVSVADGKAEKLSPELTQGVWLDWSPKGDLVAVAGLIKGDKPTSDEAGHVYLMKSDGSGLRQIDRAAAKEWAHAPTFSPDGTRLAYQVRSEQGSDLGSMVIHDLADGKEVAVRFDRLPGVKELFDLQDAKPEQGAAKPVPAPAGSAAASAVPAPSAAAASSAAPAK